MTTLQRFPPTLNRVFGACITSTTSNQHIEFNGIESKGKPAAVDGSKSISRVAQVYTTPLSDGYSERKVSRKKNLYNNNKKHETYFTVDLVWSALLLSKLNASARLWQPSKHFKWIICPGFSCLVFEPALMFFSSVLWILLFHVTYWNRRPSLTFLHLLRLNPFVLCARSPQSALTWFWTIDSGWRWNVFIYFYTQSKVIDWRKTSASFHTSYIQWSKARHPIRKNWELIKWDNGQLNQRSASESSIELGTRLIFLRPSNANGNHIGTHTYIMWLGFSLKQSTDFKLVIRQST